VPVHSTVSSCHPKPPSAVEAPNDDLFSSSSTSGKATSPERVELSESRHVGIALSRAENARSRSPSPELRPVLSGYSVASGWAGHHSDEAGREMGTDLQAQFGRYWMTSIAGAFEADLDKLRRDMSTNKDRLRLLVYSLADGANIYSESGDASDEIGTALG